MGMVVLGKSSSWEFFFAPKFEFFLVRAGQSQPQMQAKNSFELRSKNSPKKRRPNPRMKGRPAYRVEHFC